MYSYLLGRFFVGALVAVTMCSFCAHRVYAFGGGSGVTVVQSRGGFFGRNRTNVTVVNGGGGSSLNSLRIRSNNCGNAVLVPNGIGGFTILRAH